MNALDAFLLEHVYLTLAGTLTWAFAMILWLTRERRR